MCTESSEKLFFLDSKKKKKKHKTKTSNNGRDSPQLPSENGMSAPGPSPASGVLGAGEDVEEIQRLLEARRRELMAAATNGQPPGRAHLMLVGDGSNVQLGTLTFIEMPIE